MITRMFSLLSITLFLSVTSTSLLAADGVFVGKPLPPLNVQWQKTAPDLTNKPLIVEFWATWCPPCRASIPHLNTVYSKYKAKGLEIIGITNENPKLVSQFLKQVPINYNVAFDSEGKLGDSLKIETIPYAFLVDKSGKIVWEGHPMSIEDSQIQKLLK